MRVLTAVPAAASLRGAVAVVLATILTLALLPAVPAEAASEPDGEQALRDLVNAERDANGLGAFRVCADLGDTARRWSSRLADEGRLSHNPDLGEEVTGWSALAENVASGLDVDSAHRALMDSAGHRAHILSTTYTEIGVGVVRRDDVVWVTQVFREPDGSAVCEAATDVGPASERGTTACPTSLVPASPFKDTRATVHRQAIDCVVWYGLVNGTSTGRYSPSADVSRGQMASLLARLVHRSHATTPPARRHGFADIVGNPHEAAIASLAAAGIVNGTSSNRFEPNASVTRAQTATFVVATYELITGDTLPATRDAFHDDDGLKHEGAINKAAQAQLVSGVSAARYEPQHRLQRDQLASVLARALNLLVERGMLTRAY